MQPAKPRPARLLCRSSSIPSCKSSLEFFVMNDTPQWLEECNGQDSQANDWMWIGEEVEPARSLSYDPYAHPGGDEIYEICNDLASRVKLEDDGRLNIETEKDCANGHQQNPSESRKNCVNDDDMIDVL
jgi:hypothetical protein